MIAIQYAIASCAAACMVAMFVGLLYCIPATVSALPRDHTTHMIYRMIMVGISSLVAPLITSAGLHLMGKLSSSSVWKAVGLAPECNDFYSTFYPVVCIVILFLGPMVDNMLKPQTKREMYEDISLHANWKRIALMKVRALVVAPIAEEWVFRCCILPLYVAAGLSPVVSIVSTSVWFGLAHVHHVIEMRRMGASWNDAMEAIAIQLSFTTAFGCLAGYFLYETGSALSVVLMHSFCNYMNAPSLDWWGDKRRRAPVGISFAIGICGFFYATAKLAMQSHTPCSYATPKWLE